MHKWIPNQHGAWAMLIAPIVAMMLSVGPTLLQLVLLIGWLSAYCFNYFVGLVAKSWRRADRWKKYQDQLIGYGSIALIAGAVLVSAEPKLLFLAPILLLVFVVNIAAIKLGEERNWINDVLGIALSIVIGGVAGFIVSGEISQNNWKILASHAIYFIGTVWYVKTNIREKGKRSWRALSVGWHTLATVYGFLVAPALGCFFVLTTVRSLVVPNLNWKPKQVGMLEILFTISLLIIGYVVL